MTDVNTALEAQVAAEAKEIASAPAVPATSGRVGRCSFCGRVAKNLVLVDSFHGLERSRGECCTPRYSGE